MRVGKQAELWQHSLCVCAAVYLRSARRKRMSVGTIRLDCTKWGGSPVLAVPLQQKNLKKLKMNSNKCLFKKPFSLEKGWMNGQKKDAQMWLAEERLRLRGWPCAQRRWVGRREGGSSVGGRKSSTSGLLVKRIRQHSWEQAQDTLHQWRKRGKGDQESKKKSLLFYFFICHCGDRTDPLICGSAVERGWRAKLLMLSLTSSLSMKPHARYWWGTGGWEWCVGWSSCWSWHTSLGKIRTD